MANFRAIVTGASSGIGAASAAALAAAGAQLTLLDINPPAAPSGHDFIQLDISDPASIRAAVDQLAAKGPFDALCNIAGIPPRLDNQEQILVVNVLGNIALAEAILPLMASGGSVVSVASRAGARWQQNPDRVKAILDCSLGDDISALLDRFAVSEGEAYEWSKEAIIVWSMRQSVRHIGHLRFNTVSPAAVATPILDHFMDAFAERAVPAVDYTGRPGRPDEIGSVIAFLASPQSSWINGIDLLTEGGVAARQMMEAYG